MKRKYCTREQKVAIVRQLVRDIFGHLGTPEGGIVARGEIGPDVPLANMRAMYQEFMEHTY